MQTVTTLQSHKWTKIYIKGKLHIALKTNDIVGMQSWIDGESTWCIEFYMKSDIILCEYSDQNLWSVILNELNNLLT